MKRIEALDGLRGLLLVVMTINHLIWISGGYSPLQLFTLQPFGLFGGAEGFILISGLLAGLVYSDPKYSFLQLKQKAFSRAFEIYKYHIVAFILVLLLVVIYIHLMPETVALWRRNMPSLLNNSLSAFLFSLLLLNRPDFFDILPIYIIMMLVLPFIINSLRQGKLWVIAVVSVGLWLLSNHIDQQSFTNIVATVAPSLEINLGYFDLFAWQLLFTSGVVLGYSQRINPINWFLHKELVVVALILFIGLFLLHHGLVRIDGLTLFKYDDKPNLSAIRLMNLGIFTYLIAFIIHKYPACFNILGLQLIGKHSLQVFAWHSVLIYLSAPFLSHIRRGDNYELVILLLTCSLIIPAYLHQCWLKQKKPQNQPSINNP